MKQTGTPWGFMSRGYYRLLGDHRMKAKGNITISLQGDYKESNRSMIMCHRLPSVYTQGHRNRAVKIEFLCMEKFIYFLLHRWSFCELKVLKIRPKILFPLILPTTPRTHLCLQSGWLYKEILNISEILVIKNRVLIFLPLKKKKKIKILIFFLSKRKENFNFVSIIQNRYQS